MRCKGRNPDEISPMNRHILSTILLLLLFSVSAQEALDKLLTRYAHDADMVRRLKKFKSDGAQKHLDVSTYQPEDFITTAKGYLGTPYRFGGHSKAGIDCSGLISRTLQDLGLYAPHNANELARYGRIILDKNALKPGDLIFFSRTYDTPRLISHAGFVIEDEQMLHASSSGVNITSIHSPYYYDQHFMFGTRIFEAEEVDLVAEVKPAPVTKPVIREVSLLAIGYKATLLTEVYDTRFKGKYTDSGEKYRKSALTASHASFPHGTRLRLTHPYTRKSVVVVVNDGISKSDRTGLYVSAKAARKLKMKKGRRAKIRVEVLHVGNG